MAIIFHIEGKRLTQLREQMRNSKIIFKIVNQKIKTNTPYQEYAESFDIILEEQDIPAFLRLIKEASEKVEIRLYTKENKINNLTVAPYYKPYAIEDTIPPLLKTTFLYQKLKDGITFLDDYENGKAVPTYLEHIELSIANDKKVSGNYQAISYYLETGMPVAFDFGLINISSKKQEKNTLVTSKLTNYRKRIENTQTLYDYLFSIPSKTGVAEYTLEEYYIPYLEDTIIHFSDTTKKIELYERKEESINPVPIHRFSKNHPQNKTEKEICNTIEIFKSEQKQVRKRIK